MALVWGHRMLALAVVVLALTRITTARFNQDSMYNDCRFLLVYHVHTCTPTSQQNTSRPTGNINGSDSNQWQDYWPRSQLVPVMFRKQSHMYPSFTWSSLQVPPFKHGLLIHFGGVFTAMQSVTIVFNQNLSCYVQNYTYKFSERLSPFTISCLTLITPTYFTSYSYRVGSLKTRDHLKQNTAIFLVGLPNKSYSLQLHHCFPASHVSQYW